MRDPWFRRCQGGGQPGEAFRDDDRMQLDPDWVAAIGQVAGAVATSAAVVVALRIAARDRRQLEQGRLDEATGRAAMVFARDADGDTLVVNHSDRLVRDVKVTVEVEPGSRTKWNPNNWTGHVADLLPAEAQARIRSNYSLYTPGRDGKPDFVQPLNRAPADSWIVLEFIDIEGRRWVRTGDARPEWHREPAPARRRPRLGWSSLPRRRKQVERSRSRTAE